MLSLDQATHTAKLVKEYAHGDNFDAAYMGSLQLLENGNVFVGWGSQPYFSEYTKQGRLLLDGVLPSPDLTYRATLDKWTCLPLTRPSAAEQTASGKTTVYASWNGTTEPPPGGSWRDRAPPHLEAARDGDQVRASRRRSPSRAAPVCSRPRRWARSGR